MQTLLGAWQPRTSPETPGSSQLLTAPCVRLRPDVYQRLRQYILATPTEVSGIGAVTIENGDLRIDELFLLPQECSGVRTVIDSLALNRFFAEWMAAGHDPGQLRLWWHSHAAMEVYWSSTDTGHIDEYHRNAWWLSVVGNHAGDLRARLDVFQPFHLAVDWLPIVIDQPADPTLQVECERQVAEMVRTSVLTAVPDLSLSGLRFEIAGP